MFAQNWHNPMASKIVACWCVLVVFEKSTGNRKRTLSLCWGLSRPQCSSSEGPCIHCPGHTPFVDRYLKPVSLMPSPVSTVHAAYTFLQSIHSPKNANLGNCPFGVCAAIVAHFRCNPSQCVAHLNAQILGQVLHSQLATGFCANLN